MPVLRLDKIISGEGAASRRQTQRLIKSGRVIVNGTQAGSGGEKYDTDSAVITVDGVPLSYCGMHYFMMNKPAGVLTATEDPGQATVIDLLSEEHRRLGLFPVGRLDKDTSGLLLLTDDGQLAHRITSPKSHVSKVYSAKLDLPVDETDIEAFRQGITLGDGTLLRPAKLEKAGDDGAVAIVTVVEGKYHQVKRMFAARGKKVTALERIRIGKLELDGQLLPGCYRNVTEEERRFLF